MAWASAKEICDILLHSHFCVNNNQKRQDADRALREARSTAINYGDCITEILVYSNSPSPTSPNSKEPIVPVDLMTIQGVSMEDLQFIAGIQLEGLVKEGWKHGHLFSDKSWILTSLQGYLNAAVDEAEKGNAARQGWGQKLLETVIRVLARICVLDSPNDIWEGFLEGCLRAMMQVPPQTKPSEAQSLAYRFVLHVCEFVGTAAANNDTWLSDSPGGGGDQGLGAGNAIVWTWLVTTGLNGLPMSTLNPSGIPMKLQCYKKLLVNTIPKGCLPFSRSIQPPEVAWGLVNQTVEYMKEVGVYLKDYYSNSNRDGNNSQSQDAANSLMAALQVFRRLSTILPRPSSTISPSVTPIKMGQGGSQTAVILDDSPNTSQGALVNYYSMGCSAEQLDASRQCWSTVIHICLEMLFSLQSDFFNGVEIAEQLSTDLLKTLHEGYSSDDCYFTAFPALDVFETLISFAFDPWDEDPENSIEHLLNDVTDTEVCLAGVGTSERACDISCAIIQCFVAYDQGLLQQVVFGWNTAAREAADRGDAKSCAALAKMIGAVATQCEDKGFALLDAVPEAGENVIGTTVMLLEMNLPPVLRARFLLALGFICQLSKNLRWCREAFSCCLSNISSNHDLVIRTLGISSCCKIISTTNGDVSQSIIADLPAQVVEGAVNLCLSAPDESLEACSYLALLTGVRALTILMEMAPQWNTHLWRSECLPQVLNVALLGSTHPNSISSSTTTPTTTSPPNSTLPQVASPPPSSLTGRGQVVKQLATFFREIVDIHLSMNSSSSDQQHGSSSNQSNSGSSGCGTEGCSGLQQLMMQWTRVVSADDGDTHASIRPFIETVHRLALYPRCNCRQECLDAYRFLLHHVNNNGPHEEGAIRALSTAVGAACAFLPDSAGEQLIQAGAVLFQGATQIPTKRSGCVIASTAGISLGLSTVRARGLGANLLRSYLIQAANFSLKCKRDFNITGTILPVAVTLALNPAEAIEGFAQVANSGTGGAQHLLNFLSIWVSLFKFADRRTQHYSVLGWSHLLTTLRANQGETPFGLSADAVSFVKTLFDKQQSTQVSVLQLDRVHSEPKGTTAMCLGSAIVSACQALLVESNGSAGSLLGSNSGVNSIPTAPTTITGNTGSSMTRTMMPPVVVVARLANFTTGDPSFDVFDLKRQTLSQEIQTSVQLQADQDGSTPHLFAIAQEIVNVFG